jgi:hypothetical protein
MYPLEQRVECRLQSRGGEEEEGGAGGGGGLRVNEAPSVLAPRAGNELASVLWKPPVTPYIHTHFTQQAQGLLSGGTLSYMIAGLFNTGTNLAFK